MRAGAAVLLLALATAPVRADAIVIDPDNPFGAINLNQWYLAEYLSGSQRETAQQTFMLNLPPAELAELGARCDLLQPDFNRYETNVRLVCESAWGVIKSH